ncbi:MAG: AMP-binding protein [Candidatus Sericytochromatia bacterium]|nr:AMP-binding protein [Candidatus Sericytochromatia bacterium]
MLSDMFKSNIELDTYEKNIWEMLTIRATRFPERIAIQERINNVYQKTTWKDLYLQIQQIASGLISLDIKKGDKIAVLSHDCMEILALELACMSIGAIYVPIYFGYYPKQIEYMLIHSDPKYVITYDDTILANVLSTMATGRIKKYFLINYNDKYLESSWIFNFNILYKHNFDLGILLERVENVEPDDICLILHTSGGTTGISKGVEITHRNILGQQKAIQQVLDINEKDVLLSYFSWHHSQGIVEKFISVYSGGCLTLDPSPGFSPETFADNLREIKPTICFGDAKIFHELIHETKKSKNLEQAFFHEHLKFVFSGSEPSNHIIDYFIEKNTPLIQGWGLTETLQYVTISPLNEWKANTSGFPIPGIEIKLVGENSEIYVRGVNVINSYYKDEERNQESFTDDHWFKTGDSGLITENGLKILGRINSLFYLSTGKKVFASKIDYLIESSSIYISSCVVFGQNKEFVGALIFPNVPNIMKWYKEKNGYSIPLIDLLDEPEVIKLYRNKIRKTNEKNFKNTNGIKYFTLLEDEPSIKNGELTSSLTIIRKQVLENYKYLTKVFYLEDGFFPELKSRIIEV